MTLCRLRTYWTGFFLAGLLLHGEAIAQSSVLNAGDWYKISVEKEGVYKISYDLLKKMGIDPGKIEPAKLKIYGNEGGMLPQANSEPRPEDITENSIVVVGEEDGKFDKSDYILFYAQGADRAYLKASQQAYFYEKNLYDERNFYFLTTTGDAGKRVVTLPDVAGGTPVTTFTDFVHHELDDYNELKSGREWFGERFDVTADKTFDLDLPGIQENTTLRLVSDVMGQSFTSASFNVYFNGVKVGTQPIPFIINSKYAEKGVDRHDTLSFESQGVSAQAQSTQQIKYEFVKGASGKSIGYLDYFTLTFTRKLALYGDQTIFSSLSSLQNSVSKFRITDASTEAGVWDITDAASPARQQISIAQGQASFGAASTSLKKYIVFGNKFPSPEFVSKVSHQNLHGSATPNFLIVTNPAFLSEAMRLANHRQQHDGYTVLVATTEEVFNEFSSGRQDVTAIRDLARYFYKKSPGTLRNLLLIGRGSYDYKNRLANNTNFLPSYESRNSHAPLESYSSDDFYALLDDDEGYWGEDPVENNYLDIGVGRLPVKTLTEAANIIDKLIEQDSNPDLYKGWRKEIVFVADDGDDNTHTSQSNQLADFIDSNHPEFNTRKAFLDAYPQLLQPGGETSPAMNKAIIDYIDRGSLIINYTGHGGEKLWAQEKIFDEFAIADLDNPVYPLFVTATCAFGRQDDPFQISGAELNLIRKKGGAIGMVSTGRDVYSNTNYELNLAFYEALFEKENDVPLTLGEIFKRTKNNSTTGVSNRNFSLLGDPSMTLSFPQQTIALTSVKTENESDTLNALSTVIVNGEILNTEGNTDSAFNGFVETTLFDKKTSFTTLGNENAPFNYTQWYNALYRGKASVENGLFTMKFIIPKNIAYAVGNGKLSLYAADPTQGKDASGADLDLSIGKSETNPGSDTTPPLVTVFLGDTTFINGGITTPDTRLVVKLSDASGINISSYGIANNLMAILDDNDVYVLNDYYESDLDNFTTGWVNFPLRNLTPGRHTITINAWDTFNNPASASVDFIVTDGETLQIETFQNFPNPFAGHTTLYFTHNRSGDDLQGSLVIMDVTGNIIKTAEFLVNSSPYRVNLLEIEGDLDLGKKLTGGLYLARLVVRSLTNGSKSEQVTKLISVN